MGHAQLQEKEPPAGFAGYLTRCRPVPRVGMDRNSKCWCCHLQLSPGSALNRNLGRPPVEDTDFLRRGKSFEIPLFPAQNPRLWLGWGRSPPGTGHCRQSWRKNKPEASKFTDFIKQHTIAMKNGREIQDLALLNEGQSVFPHGIVSFHRLEVISWLFGSAFPPSMPQIYPI